MRELDNQGAKKNGAGLLSIGFFATQMIALPWSRVWPTRLALLSIGLLLSGGGGHADAPQRLLAVGGVHELAAGKACSLSSEAGASALQNLGWSNALVVRARNEGIAYLVCADERTTLRMVAPARLDLVLLDDQKVIAGRRFHVRAVVRDTQGRELELGKWTEPIWRTEGVFSEDPDRSAGEFGLCATCHGIQAFKATVVGDGLIEARFGNLAGILRLRPLPPPGENSSGRRRWAVPSPNSAR